MNLAAVEKTLNYSFKDKKLLERALTLASVGENNNQTLEFFGDAILEFIVSERIFNENMSEGELTEKRKALVSDSALRTVSLKLGLDKFLIRGSGDTNNKKAVPSVYEAAVAAIYLDGGIERAREFVLNTLDFSLKTKQMNFKGQLQEKLQAAGLPCPVYGREELGTAQNPRFRATLNLNGKMFSGTGATLRQAEQDAAENALKNLEL